MAATKKTVGDNGFEAMSAMNPETLKEGYERMSKGMTALADFQKESLEAVIASASACARGFEKAASEQSAFMKEAYEEGVAAQKAASTAKSLQEAFEVHTEFARNSFEKNLNFASKLAEHWSGVAKEAADPMSKRYGEFVEMVQSYRP